MPRNFTARRGRPSADEQSGPIKIEYFVDGDMRPQLTVMNRTVRIVGLMRCIFSHVMPSVNLGQSCRMIVCLFMREITLP